MAVRAAPNKARAKERASVPLDERLTVGMSEAASMSGLGRDKLYDLIQQGRLKSRRIDGKRLVDLASLRELLVG